MKKRYLLISFLIPLSLSLLLFFLLNFLTGEVNFLMSDSFSQYYRLLFHLKNVFSGTSNIFYSFAKGLGGAMVSTYAYYLSSPINILLVLFDNVYIFYLLATLLKIGLCGTSMYCFLNYHFKDKNNHLLAFSTSYALSTFVIGNYFQIMWLDGILIAPLILLGIDKIIDSKKPLLYGICLFLGVLSNYYIGYILCVFSVIYFIYRLVLSNQNKKHIKKDIVMFLITSILSGMMTMFLNIPNILATINGVRYTATYMGIFNTDVFGLLSKFFIGAVNMDNFLNKTHALLYCGIFIIPLLLFYFINKNINKKEKIASLIVLLIFLVSILFNPINYAWHMFSPPNCYNARYTFLIILFMIYLSCKSFFNLKYITKLQALSICPLIIIALFVYIFSDLSIYSMYISVTLYLIYIFLFLNIKNKDVKVLFIFLALAELFFNMYLIFFSFKKVYYNNDYVEGRFEEKKETINYLKKIDNSFYRVEFDEDSFYNDSYYIGYNCSTTFLSTLNMDISFFEKIGYYTGNSYDHIAYPVMDAIFNIKYYESVYDTNLYSEIYRHEISPIPFLYGKSYIDSILYQNPYALSLGFMINSDTNLDSDIFNNQNKIIKTMTGKDVDVYIKNEVNNNGIYKFNVIDNNDFYIEIFTKNSNNEAYEVYINDKLFNIDINTADTIYLKNDFEIGEEVIIRTNNQDVDNIYVYSFNKDNFLKHINILKNNELNIEKYSDGYVKGNINVNDKKKLFLSIPYEKGWNIYVDGVKVDYYKLFDTFIGLDLESGYHEIEMIYKTPGLKLGIVVSIVSSVLFISYMIYVKKKYN